MENTEKEKSKKTSSGTNGSLERALMILEHMATYGIAESVPEISRKLNINKVTTYKLMRTLEAQNYVRKIPDGKYILTSRMFEFGSMFCNSNPLTHLFHQNANMLLKIFSGCELYLGVLADKIRGVYLSSTASDSPYLTSGTGFPLHATAIGKVLLAFSPQDFQSEFFLHYDEKALTQYTTSTVQQTSLLAEQLKDIREKGYCINMGEYIMNTNFVAAPVFGPQKELLAAISIGANYNFFKENQNALLRETRAFSARLSTSMGYIPNPL